AVSQGQITRHDLVKWGLITAGGLWAPPPGFGPFAQSALGSGGGVPTGAPPRPPCVGPPVTYPTLRLHVLPRKPNPFTYLNPAPTAEANTTQQLLNPALPGVNPGDTGPIEGRPPGPIWAHQNFDTLRPKIAVRVTQEGAKTNTTYTPG